MAKPATTSKRPDGLETRDAAPLTFRAQVRPESIDAEARTVEVVWSTGADGQRYDWRTGEYYVESLAMGSKNIRLGRLNSRAPVLDSHHTYGGVRSVLAVVESARVENGEGIAKIRFSKRDDVEPVWQDVRDGITGSLSVGYVVHGWKVERKTEKTLEKRTAVDWEPYEISLVPIPFDTGAKVRSYEEDVAARGAEEEKIMTEEEIRAKAAADAEAKRQAEAAQQRAREEADQSAIVAERKRASEIDALCVAHGVSAEKRSKWIADGASANAVREAILNDQLERQRATHVSPITSGNAQRDQNMVRDATDALMLRAGHKVDGEGHRNFAGGSLLRMAERVLESGGVNTRTLTPDGVAKRALATSDFADILNAVGSKIVRNAYDTVPLVHRVVFRRATASDFKARNLPQVSAGEVLEEVPEGGPIQRQAASAEMASYALKTYGKIIPITRKLIINDDFDFVARVGAQRGRAAAETERKTVWDFIKSNPTAPDGTAVFHADHANTTTAGSGASVSAATLAAARKALREQTSPDGVAINALMRHVVCGTDTETAWDQLINGIYVPTAATTAMTETMRRQTQVHVEPLVEGEDWFGFTDYNQIDTFEFAYLAGSEGVQLEQRWGFDVEGLELKVVLDFGVGCIDHRGSYWMDGA